MTSGRRGTRRRIWLWWSVSSVGLAVGAFVAGQYVTSPWESAEANAARAVLPTAQVVAGSVSEEVPSVSGEVSLGRRISVSPTPDGELPVVTLQPLSPGRGVSPGDAVTWVAGRPVIALDLPYPLYRDLRGGDSGSDVSAVQAALKRLGYYGGPVDGILGDGTKSAIGKLYSSIGAEPPPTPADVKAEYDSALATYNELANPGADQSAAAASPADVAKATAALDASRLATGAWLPAAEVLAIPSSAVTVSATAAVGTVLTDGTSAVELLAGEPTVVARVAADETDVFASGSVVDVAVPGVADALEGKVAALSDFRPAQDALPPGYDVTISLTSTDGLSDGDTVTVTPHGAGQEKSGLVVPLTAIQQDTSGYYVQVVDQNATSPRSTGDTRRVSVEVGISANGYALVSGDLKAGEAVVVGPQG